jgi:hypothetical protein
MSRKLVLVLGCFATALYLTFVLWISYTVIPFGETWDVRGSGQQMFSFLLLLPLIPLWVWLLRRPISKSGAAVPVRHPEDGTEDTSGTIRHERRP